MRLTIALTQGVDMSITQSSGGTNDPYNLNRFVEAQHDTYEQALSELNSGRKRSHWMWYIFPQLDGLGFSSTSRLYAIKNLDEARAILEHPLLGPRLLECAQAVLRIDGRTASQIFGSPDDMKLKSCATLFACVSPDGSVFHRLLARYYGRGVDSKTLRLLGLEDERTGEIGKRVM
jgi:uncharacterized protein (DUF1810 family)